MEAKTKKEFVDEAVKGLSKTGIDKKKLEELAGKEFDQVRDGDKEQTEEVPV